MGGGVGGDDKTLIFFIEKNGLNQLFFGENAEPGTILRHFLRISSFFENIYTSGHFDVYLLNVL